MGVFKAVGLSALSIAAAALMLFRAPAEATASPEQQAHRPNVASGPAAVLRARIAQLDALLKHGIPTSDPRARELRREIDTVAGQRHAHVSKLFWHRNIDHAFRRARREGKPILSLRLLGRLDEELSCANSRFFRVALYANAEVSRFLRDNVVLHWSTERPAPVITIDFGDGRRVVRTITGNSIHYLLDADGTVVDALPGLYGPAMFLKLLRRSVAMARAGIGRSALARRAIRQRYHRRALRALGAKWNAEVRRVGFASLVQPIVVPSRTRAPSALRAAPIAIAKRVVEMPVLRRTMRPSRNPAPPEHPVWRRLAALQRRESRLDDQSRQLIRALRPRDWTQKTPRPLSATGLASLVTRFEGSMALDSVRNEHLLHRTIHRWLADEPLMGWLTLNARVYRQLFLTPKSDPWLGLTPPLAFTGIEDDGVQAK